MLCFQIFSHIVHVFSPHDPAQIIYTFSYLNFSPGDFSEDSFHFTELLIELFIHMLNLWLNFSDYIFSTHE